MMTDIVRVQAFARGYLQRRIVPVNAGYLLPCKVATVDDVPVHKAAKHFVYDLVTRRARLYGVKLNAPTVLRMLRHQRGRYPDFFDNQLSAGMQMMFEFCRRLLHALRRANDDNQTCSDQEVMNDF